MITDFKTYTADEITTYVLWVYKQNKKPITNLKLQKILYILQICCNNYHKKHFDSCKMLIDLTKTHFEAWDLGPVIPDIYFTYSIFAGNPISFDILPKTIIDIDTINIITPYLTKTFELSTWDLIRMTKETYGYYETYSPDNKKQTITFEMINQSTINL